MKPDLHVFVFLFGCLALLRIEVLSLFQRETQTLKGVCVVYFLLCVHAHVCVFVLSQPVQYLCYWLSLFRGWVIRSDCLSPRVKSSSKVTVGSTVCNFLLLLVIEDRDLAGLGSTIRPENMK